MLSDVKVGDKLLITKNSGFKFVDSVNRITKLHVITSSDRKFRKIDGSLVTQDKWCFVSATPMTETEYKKYKEDKEKHQKHIALVSTCQQIDFKSLSDETLTKILETVNNQ